MFRLFTEVILNLLVMLFNAVSLFLKWLPSILVFLRDVAQIALVMSCELYRGILTRLQPLTLRVRINLVVNPWRIVACILLSLLFGVAVMLLVGWSITPPGMAICALHGLAVGIVWDQMGPPNGIHLGV
jgi:hypothetical protein